jgi:glycosyltransferase involved in cell wall biosynthesis
VIAGEGSHRGELEHLARDLGISNRVDWRGYVDHDAVQRVYEDIGLLVVPSRTTRDWSEQFGRVVIEALAAGVPVVASDSGELPNLLASTGGGWIVPEDDSDALRERLAVLLADPNLLTSTAQAARANVRENYSLRGIAEGFIDAVSSAADAVVAVGQNRRIATR